MPFAITSKDNLGGFFTNSWWMLLPIAQNFNTDVIQNNKVSAIALTTAVLGAGTAMYMTYSLSSQLEKTSSKLAAEQRELTAGEETLMIQDIERVAKISQISAAIVALAISVYAVNELYPIACNIASYFFPSEEQIARTAAAVKSNKIFEAKKTFRDCLIKSLEKKGYETNASGIPTVCEQAAQMLEKVGGKNEADTLTETFNSCNKHS